MKPDRSVFWVTLGAPLLVALAILSLQLRQGRDRIQVLPAVLVGSGLMISRSIVRRRRRSRLLRNFHQARADEPHSAKSL